MPQEGDCTSTPAVTTANGKRLDYKSTQKKASPMTLKKPDARGSDRSLSGSLTVFVIVVIPVASGYAQTVPAPTVEVAQSRIDLLNNARMSDKIPGLDEGAQIVRMDRCLPAVIGSFFASVALLRPQQRLVRGAFVHRAISPRTSSRGRSRRKPCRG